MNSRSSSNSANTVTFNVGGTIHEVSISLINQYPDTMLARMVSETWQPSDSKEPLFIERDGERFRYCLDFMRDGGIVDLPPTVSMNALLRDLAFYGFHDVDPSKISVTASLPLFVKLWDGVNNELSGIEQERNIYALAHHCLSCVKKDRSLRVTVNNRNWSEGTIENILCGGAMRMRGSKNCGETQRSKELFNTLLGRMGLKLKSVETSGYYGYTIALEFL